MQFCLRRLKSALLQGIGKDLRCHNNLREITNSCKHAISSECKCSWTSVFVCVHAQWGAWYSLHGRDRYCL